MRALAPCLILALSLTACTTPREACERDALHELTVLDGLIAETRQNLARGYGLAREPYTVPHLEACHGVPVYDAQLGTTVCQSSEIAYRDRPVALDMRAERRKLRSLRAKRKSVAREAAIRLAACRAQYPEG